MKRTGLRTQLTFIYSLVLAGILVSITAASYQFLKYRLNDGLRQELRERAAGLRGYLHFEGGRPQFRYDPNDPEEAFFVESNTRYYQIFDRMTGQLLDRSHELDLLDLDLDPEEQKAISDQDFSEAEANDVRLVFHNEILSAGGKSFLLQLGMRRDSTEAALRQFLLMTLVMVPAGLGIAGAVSWWMAGRALQPIRALSRAAEEIEISSLDKRLPLAGNGDEIDRLSENFNNMFARLSKAISEMKQFTASISHELRTPLTALRGEAEVVLLQPCSVEDYRRVLASHLEEYEKLGRLINKLLTLARAESGDILLKFARLDLSLLAQSLVEQLEAVAASKNIDLTFDSSGPVYVIADSEWMESAILNLLDNAIKYTPEGGRISVRIENTGIEQRLAISDTGAGIAADALPHIFERFYRADPYGSGKSEGYGLGLSLVDWIIKQHSGRIEVESRPGAGSCFILWLKAAEAEQFHRPPIPQKAVGGTPFPATPMKGA